MSEARPDGSPHRRASMRWCSTSSRRWLTQGNLVIERIEGDGREWFWRSVAHRAPETIRFSGPTLVEVVDEEGSPYKMQFDLDSLEPTERSCLRPEYCYSHPWDN